jgi:hypothetical protein
VLGNQRPRICQVPKYSSTTGDEAIELAAMAGLYLDDWQQFVLRHSLGETREGKWAAREVGLMVSRQNGKGPHSLDTPVLTTDGWTTFADIAVGQSVYGSDGRPTEVIARSDVYLGNACYEVEFTDGARYVVGGEHLWRVRRKDRRDWEVLSTSVLAQSVGGRRADSGRMEYNWRVRCDAMVSPREADLPIDPYIFGYWLGDGSRAKAAITTGHQDHAYVRERLALAGYSVIRDELHDHGRARTLSFSINAKMRDGFESRCRRLGVWGEKHIPAVYLLASVEQRKALLAGLMDSDGSIATASNDSPLVELASSYPRLAADIMCLLRSLGVRTRVRTSSTTHRERQRFQWTPTFNPFWMPRKAAFYKPPTSRRHELMSVVAIRSVPSVPTRCIQVAAEDGVYLVGRQFTPTHNSVLEARELAGLFLLEEGLIVHTAHLFDTAGSHFARLSRRIEDTPILAARLAKPGGILRGHGNESITLARNPETGCQPRLEVRTRTGAGGLGFSIDCLVFDEAMIISEEMHQALLPTLSARPNVQVWYTGSAVDEMNPAHQGVPFARIREKGIKGAPSLAFFEWSLDVDDPDKVGETDEADWAFANPSLNIRLDPGFIREVELDSLSENGFAVQRLGVGRWPRTDGLEGVVITPDAWKACFDADSKRTGGVCFAIDVTPMHEYASIGVAGVREDGLWHVEVIDHRRSTGWVVERIVELVATKPTIGVVIDGSSPANSLLSDLAEALDIEITITTGKEHGQACGMFIDAIRERTLRHIGQGELAEATRGAVKRSLGEAWAWSRKNSGLDISPLVAVTLALWGLQTLNAPVEPQIIDMNEVYREMLEAGEDTSDPYGLLDPD